MTPDTQNLWATTIDKVARGIGRSFPNVDPEDIYQDLWGLILERPALDPESPGISSLLTTEAKRLAWNQRKQQLHGTSQYEYVRDDVVLILEELFFYEDWRGFTPADAWSEDGMGPVEVRSDVSSAFRAITNPSYTNSLVERFRDKVIHEAGTAGRKMLNRAVNTLTDILNSRYASFDRVGGPGQRRVLSNATAAAMIRRDMES